MRIPSIMALWATLWGSLFTSGLSAETAAPQSQSFNQMPVQVNVGFTVDKFSGVDAKDAKAAMKLWLNMVSPNRPREVEKVEMLTYPDLPSMTMAGKEKKIDVMFLTSVEYFQMKSGLSFEPVATSTPLGGGKTQFVVLVRRDRGILRMGELKSKSFLAEKGDNRHLLWMWLETVIMKEGYPDVENFLPNLKEVNGTLQAVLPVFFGQANSCVAYRSAFEIMKEMNPQLGKELIPIASSPEFARGIICIRQDVLKKHKWLVDEMLSIHNKPQGKQILTLMKIGKLIAFEPDHLATAEALLREHKSLNRKLAKGG